MQRMAVLQRTMLWWTKWRWMARQASWRTSPSWSRMTASAWVETSIGGMRPEIGVSGRHSLTRSRTVRTGHAVIALGELHLGPWRTNPTSGRRTARQRPRMHWSTTVHSQGRWLLLRHNLPGRKGGARQDLSGRKRRRTLGRRGRVVLLMLRWNDLTKAK